jgi:hypothetical protein
VVTPVKEKQIRAGGSGQIVAIEPIVILERDEPSSSKACVTGRIIILELHLYSYFNKIAGNYSFTFLDPVAVSFRPASCDPTDEKYISRGTHHGLGMQRLMINCDVRGIKREMIWKHHFSTLDEQCCKT